MGLETGTYISDLNTANPTSGDPKSQGDDHIRLLKSTIKTTFPNVTGAVTPTHTELNYVDGVTSAIQTQIDSKGAITGQTWTGTHTFPSTTSIGNVSSTEIGYLDGVTSAVQTQLDNKQPLDADLTALAALSTTGVMARTAANTYVMRTLTAPAAGITVSNGDGVSGNPTLALANDLAALEGLSSTGMVVRTGDGTATTRTITAGSGVTITNGDGVSGNPTITVGPGVGFGDVLGPASSTDGYLAVFDGTTGKLLKSGGAVPNGNVVGVSSSVDGEIALFDSTTGKVIKRATTSGVLKATSGVIGTATLGTDYGYVDIPQSGSDKTTSYTLATTDNGKFIGVGTSGSITIPDATFSAGNAVTIFNNTTGNVTITCTITTAYIAGADSDKATITLATRGVANILFLSGTVCVVTGNVS